LPLNSLASSDEALDRLQPLERIGDVGREAAQHPETWLFDLGVAGSRSDTGTNATSGSLAARASRADSGAARRRRSPSRRR
jgi:hypothetical protein